MDQWHGWGLQITQSTPLIIEAGTFMFRLFYLLPQRIRKIIAFTQLGYLFVVIQDTLMRINISLTLLHYTARIHLLKR